MANTDRGYGPLCNHMYMYDLGWLVKTILSFREELDTAIDLKTIHYADPIQWDITTQYSPNTVVVDPKTGTAYMSKVSVPAGVQLDNTDYWVVIFNYQRIYDKIMSGVAFNDKENLEASKDISKYDFVWFGGDLYQAQRDIPQGSKYVPGANIAATTIADALATYYGRDRVAQVINDTLTVSETQTINTKNRVVNVTGDYHIDVDGATTDNRSGAVTKTYGSSLNAEVTGTYTAEYRDTAIDNADGKRIINAKDIVLNSVNPLTYKKPTDFSQKYKSIQFKDINNNNYNVLVGDEKSYTSVTDFGADATGIADSTEAVQKSIDLLGYAFFTPGSYLINNCQLKSNTFIFGIGATLFYDKNGVNDSVFTTYVEPFSESNNIIIKNLKFTVKNHTTTEYGRCLMLNGCKNVKIENCIFENWNGDAILIDNHGIVSDSSKYYDIINCKFFNDGKARQAISIVGGRYITIRNCYFNNTTSFNMPGAIDVEPYENYNFNMDNIYIINCTSENNNRPLLNSYLIFNNNVDVVIDGCNVINGDLRDGSIFNGIAHIENINGNIKYKITNCYIKSDEIGLQSSASTGIVSNNIFENCLINSGYKNFNNNNPDESIEITKNIFNRTEKKNEVNAILIKAASGKQVSITENIFNVFDPDLYGCIGIDGATAKSFTLCDNIYKELNNSDFGYIVNGLDVNNLIKGNIAPKEINIIYNVGCAESVTINPSTAIAAKGETATFNAILTGNNPLDVEWELIGSSTSSINNGTVSISSNEVAEILTVKATAKGINRLEAYGSVIIK